MSAALLLLSLQLVCFSLRRAWTPAPARLGEPSPSPLAAGARVFEHRSVMLGARQTAPDHVRSQAVFYLWVFIYPHGRASGIFAPLVFITRARPVGGRGAGAERRGGPPTVGWGGGAKARRLAGEQTEELSEELLVEHIAFLSSSLSRWVVSMVF